MGRSVRTQANALASDPYEQLWEVMRRRGVSPGVINQLKKVAGRWAKKKRR